MRLTSKIKWFNTISVSARILSGTMVGIIILFLLPLVIPYVEDATEYGYIRSALAIEHAITVGVKHGVPTKIAGKEIARWLIILFAFVTSGWLSGVSSHLQDRAEYYGFKRNIEEWRQKVNLAGKDTLFSPLMQKLERLKNAGKKDRDRLLNEFAQIKKTLDKAGRELAFLSFDVFDSLGLKQGEERATIEHD